MSNNVNMERSPKCIKPTPVLHLILAKSLQINDAAREKTLESDKNWQSSSITFDSVHNERVVVRHISQNKYKIYKANIQPDSHPAPQAQNVIQQHLNKEHNCILSTKNQSGTQHINNTNDNNCIDDHHKLHRHKALHKCITPDMNANIMNNTLLYLLQISKIHSATNSKIRSYFYHQSFKLVTNCIRQKVHNSFSKRTALL
jgi:hypothetical protein